MQPPLHNPGPPRDAVKERGSTLGPKRVISLFSGAGGLDLGFIQAGHNVVFAIDNDVDAVASYRKNIGEHIHLEDISSLDHKLIPDGDLVIGGFPCQGFSRANKFREADDERNELYLEFVRVLASKKPRYFLAENVRGLLSLDQGRVMEMIVEDFASAGYAVSYRLLNAADYGIPQSRQRVIIVGVRSDIASTCAYDFPNPTHSSKPTKNGLPSWRGIGAALTDVPEPHDEHGLLNHVYSKYKVTNRNYTGHRKTDPSKPSPTILARGNKGGGVCAIQHPLNHRRLSVRESAIIQTFPNDFEFEGTMNSMYRQIGNAVPVELARVLAVQFCQLP